MPAADRWPDIAGRLEGTEHVLPVRVYFEDTDFSGLVYHASYLRFCERGRSDLLRLAGLSHREMIGGDGDGGQGGAYFAVTRMAIEFLQPARIDDLLEVRSRFGAIGGARLRIDQAVTREGADIVLAEVWVAILGADGRPKRVSRALKSVLEPLAAPARGGAKG